MLLPGTNPDGPGTGEFAPEAAACTDATEPP